MTWFRVVIALCAVVVALSVASFAVRGYIDWHDKRQARSANQDRLTSSPWDDPEVQKALKRAYGGG